MNHKVALYGIAVFLFFFVMIAGTPSPAHAEEPSVMDWLDEEKPNGQTKDKETNDSVELNHSNEKSPMFLIGQLIFYTLIILVLIYALIRFLALKQKKLQPNQAVNLIGGTALGNNKSLQLVKVGGKVYLIGVADQITLIKEFSNADEINTIESDLEKQPTFFTNSLFSFSKNMPSTSEYGGFDQLFNQSLSKQKEKQNQLEKALFDDTKEEGREK